MARVFKNTVFLAIVALSLGAPSQAQLPDKLLPTEAPVAAQDELSREGVVVRRAKLRTRLEERDRLVGAESPREANALAWERELLEGIDRLLVLQLSELRRAEELEIEADRLPEFQAAGLDDRFGHPPPYSVGELDAVLEELEAATAARALRAESRQESERELERARAQLETLESEQRIAREQASDSSREQQQELRRLSLEVEAGRERLRLRSLRLRDAERSLEIQKAGERKLQELTGEIRDQLVPSPAELDDILAALAERTRLLDQALADARGQIEATEDRWSAAQERVEMAAEPTAAVVAQAEARRLTLATVEHRQELLQKQILRAHQLEDLWRLRFGILADELSEDLVRGAAELGRQDADLDRERRLTEARLTQRRLSLKLLRESLERVTAQVERSWLGEQRDELEKAVEYYEQELQELDRMTTLVRRTQAELEERRGLISVGDRLEVMRQNVAETWRFEIFSADGSPITVGKVLTALLLILIGYLFSKFLSRRFGRSVLPRLGVAKGAAVAFQTLLYYALLAVFFLWALRLVNIPLTVFTVLGGVLAIGIGFGSQNIMNNFISGLIILAEHPVKVGDLIEVEGVFGQVERIGPRSSRIRAGDNTHVIVPNSAFLEKNVLNWTVSDDVIRTSVDVGVAYGSPVEEVARSLKQAIAEEPTVLEQPPSEVLFTEFGDNSLLFRAYFWVRVTRPLDRHRAQSKLRFRIDDILRRADIVIAFPQRDVHLDSLSPVQVRLVAESDAAPGTAVPPGSQRDPA